MSLTKKRLPRRKVACRLSRRLGGLDINRKSGIRPLDSKCKLETPPGQHGVARRGSPSDYNIQLKKKQEFRGIYDVGEKQFRNYFKAADKKSGNTGENLLKLLESRLNSVVFDMGFASTRGEARQLISHKAIMVNGGTVNIPSYLLKPGDIVSIREISKGQLRIAAAQKLAEELRPTPSHLEMDYKKKEGIFKDYPTMDELPPELVNTVSLVVELYSK